MIQVLLCTVMVSSIVKISIFSVKKQQQQKHENISYLLKSFGVRGNN